MIRNGQFSAAYSLAELATQLDAFEIIWGGVTAVGNHQGSTVGTFDSTKSGAGTLVLRPGTGSAQPGETFVCSGTVFVLSQLQAISVFRK